MKKDFSDLSIVISVRIDSAERLENVREIVRFLQTYTAALVYIVEADKEKQIPDLGVEEQLFFMDTDPVFHRTRYSNIILKHTRTPFIGLWDADVVIDPRQLEIAMEWLRSGKNTLIIPYNECCYDVLPEFRKEYLKRQDITFLHASQKCIPFKFGRYALGGIFLIRREDYEKAGWENEHFYGWGHEDVERVKRAEILGAKIGFVQGCIYHLYHPRLMNSAPATRKQDTLNRAELLKICSMNADALQEYVASWKNEVMKI